MNNSDKYKTITDTAKKKRKKRRKRIAQMVDIMLKLAEIDKAETDANMSIPFAPAEPAPIGMLDGIYPKSDLEDKSVGNLYYGVLDSHFADDTDEGREKHIKYRGFIITMTYIDDDGDWQYNISKPGEKEPYGIGWSMNRETAIERGKKSVDKSILHKDD